MDIRPFSVKCSKPWCKQLLPNPHQRQCDHCRERDKENQRACRARNKAKTTASGHKAAIGQKRGHHSTEDMDGPPSQRAKLDHDGISGQEVVHTQGDEDDCNSDNAVSLCIPWLAFRRLAYLHKGVGQLLRCRRLL